MSPRPMAVTLALMAGTVIAGLTVRFAPLGLPHFVVKYGGSTMWALMAYWIVSALLPSWRLVNLILLTGALTTGVEFFKLYHSPGMDAFRLTLPGILVLGSYFSGWDILAYWLAIAAGAILDHGLRQQANRI